MVELPNGLGCTRGSSPRGAAVAAAIVAGLLVGRGEAAPPEYNVLDVTNWTAQQMQALPFFKHFMPTPPSGPGVPANFSPAVRSTSGLVAGTGPVGLPYSGSLAYRLTPMVGSGWASDPIAAFGTFNWGYWSCDSHDCHFYWGYIRDCEASDINHAGVIVGFASMPGSGSSPLGVVYHGYRDDPVIGQVDLFPSAATTYATCINNNGEIGGYMFGEGSPFSGGFRRDPDGSLTELNPINNSMCLPRWINARGQIIGSHYPSRSFVSPSGATTISLPPPGAHPRVQANDLNDEGWIVGWCGPFNDPEVFATIWEPRPDGTWQAWDLTEKLLDHSVILEQALCINARGEILARGHLDGTDLFSSRLYLLSPVEPLAGWCLPDIGRQPADADACGGGTVTFAVEVVNVSDVMAYQWRRDGEPIPPAANPSASTATLVLSGVVPADSGVFDCVITSACGSVTSRPALLASCCAADINRSGDLTVQDLFDFLGFYFAQDLRGDFNRTGGWTVQDIFDFVAAYFTGCG